MSARESAIGQLEMLCRETKDACDVEALRRAHDYERQLAAKNVCTVDWVREHLHAILALMQKTSTGASMYQVREDFRRRLELYALPTSIDDMPDEEAVMAEKKRIYAAAAPTLSSEHIESIAWGAYAADEVLRKLDHPYMRWQIMHELDAPVTRADAHRAVLQQAAREALDATAPLKFEEALAHAKKGRLEEGQSIKQRQIATAGTLREVFWELPTSMRLQSLTAGHRIPALAAALRERGARLTEALTQSFGRVFGTLPGPRENKLILSWTHWMHSQATNLTLQLEKPEVWGEDAETRR